LAQKGLNIALRYRIYKEQLEVIKKEKGRVLYSSFLRKGKGSEFSCFQKDQKVGDMKTNLEGGTGNDLNSKSFSDMAKKLTLLA
jgi:hypothetical protein